MGVWRMAYDMDGNRDLGGARSSEQIRAHEPSLKRNFALAVNRLMKNRLRLLFCFLFFLFLFFFFFFLP